MEIRFRYYNPILYRIINVIVVMIAVGMLILTFRLLDKKMLPFGSFISAIVVVPVSVYFILFYLQNNFIDQGGTFRFDADKVVLNYAGKRRSLRYDDIKEISREWYQQPVPGGSRSNANEYRIRTRKETYVLRVSHHEERIYHRRINRLTGKLYRFNRLSVHLSYKSKDGFTSWQRDAASDLEKPDNRYSLVKAIDILLEKTGLELVDNISAYHK